MEILTKRFQSKTDLWLLLKILFRKESIPTKNSIYFGLRILPIPNKIT